MNLKSEYHTDLERKSSALVSLIHHLREQINVH